MCIVWALLDHRKGRHRFEEYVPHTLRRPPEGRQTLSARLHTVDEFVLVTHAVDHSIDCEQLRADDGGAPTVPHRIDPTRLCIAQQRLDVAAHLVAFLLFNNVFPFSPSPQLILCTLTIAPLIQRPNSPPPRPDPRPYPSSTHVSSANLTTDTIKQRPNQPPPRPPPKPYPTNTKHMCL